MRNLGGFQPLNPAPYNLAKPFAAGACFSSALTSSLSATEIATATDRPSTWHSQHETFLEFLTALTFSGAISRLTLGWCTPSFYRYQMERAPDDAFTWYIPLVDVTVGPFLSFSKPQSVAAFLCVMFQGFGIVVELRKGGRVLPNVETFLMASVAFGLGTGVLRGHRLAWGKLMS